MRIQKNSLRVLGTTALLALGLGVTGCHTTDRTAGQAINDKMTAFNVRHELDRDPVLKYPDVKVNVYNGTAQLTGFVNTDEQRTKAAEIAANVQGVRQVINEITTKPQPTGRAEIHNMAPQNVPPQEPPPAR